MVIDYWTVPVLPHASQVLTATGLVLTVNSPGCRRMCLAFLVLLGLSLGCWSFSSTLVIKSPKQTHPQHFPEGQFPHIRCSWPPLHHPRTLASRLKAWAHLSVLQVCQVSPPTLPGAPAQPSPSRRCSNRSCTNGPFLKSRALRLPLRDPGLILGDRIQVPLAGRSWQTALHFYTVSTWAFHNFSPVLRSLPRAIWFQKESLYCSLKSLN